jgi:TonB family protein
VPSPTSAVTARGAGVNPAETIDGGTKLDGAGAGSSAGPADGMGPGDSNGRRAVSGAGRWDGGSGDGMLAAIGGGDTPGTEYGPYLAGVRRQIAESLRYPPSARRRRLTGTVQLEIVIAASGAITAAEVVVSSSHALLDAAAVDTVKSLRPQPFPSNLRARTLRVRLPVVFTLE